MQVLALLLIASTAAIQAGIVHGVVRDTSASPVQRARVQLRTVLGTIVQTATSNETGEFRFEAAPGHYLLSTQASGFAGSLRVVQVNEAPDPALRLEVQLDLAIPHSSVTVSASRGRSEELTQAAAIVATVEPAALLRQAGPTLGNALAGLPGVAVQQTTYGQVSPFLRGLTGYHVLNLVDGIRFNNSTFRSGPNQYLAFLDVGPVERVEVMLGPSSSLYGSDALGGVIHLLSPEPRFATGSALEWHGMWNGFGNSADLSAGSRASLSAASDRAFLSVGASARKHNDLRPGRGVDSHSVFRRLFGLEDRQIQSMTGSRLQDSGFSQTSIHARSTWMPTDRSSVSAAFIHSDLHNVRAYNNLLGGLGRLQATFEPQRLNLLYLRYERLAFGWLDSISGTFSVNSQHDGAVRQGLRVSDPAIVDNNRADVFGYTAQAAAGSTVFGAELYAERIRSERSEGVIARRPLYPDDSAYRTTSAFVQHSRQLLRNRIRLQAGGRVTAVRYRTDEAPVFGVTQSRQTFRDATFNASAGWQVSRWIALNLLVGRGFRAPNSNDLGAVGLNDLGYEIPASEATGLGAVLSNSAGEGATSLGRPVADLRPERLWNYEAGIRIAAKRLHARAQFYDFELLDPIVRRTLLFPADAVPSALGGLAVRAIAQTPEQRVQNVVAVAAAIDPRGMKAFVNDGHARYYGVDSTLEWRLNPRAHLRTSYSYITGRELNPNRRVRRLPPQNGSGSLHVPLLRRLWMETSVLFAGPQSRLSGGDLDDERIGASRSLRDISDFFASSRTSVYLQGVVFGPTGETLAEIQGRVLPGISSAAARVPLYSRTAGWVDASVRGGFLLRESLMLNASWTNMLDKNYRVHGSGVDSPGRSVFLGFTYQF